MFGQFWEGSDGFWVRDSGFEILWDSLLTFKRGKHETDLRLRNNVKEDVNTLSEAQQKKNVLCGVFLKHL